MGREENDRRRDDWMASQYHGREFEQVLGDGEGQGSLVRAVPGVANS